MTGYTEMGNAPAPTSGRPGIIVDLADNLAVLNQRAAITRGQLLKLCERLGLSDEAAPPRDDKVADLPGQIAAAQRQIGDLYTTMDDIDHAISVLNRL